MAGDWFKVEHATLRKPEILEAAEYLNLGRRETLGIFLEYFAWLDQNLRESCNGTVSHITRKSLEDSLGCAGFTAMLEAIGWAKFDDAAHTLTVKNWARHNGSTAKSRALVRDRVAKHRNANTVTSGNASGNARPLPEKRREEVDSRSKTMLTLGNGSSESPPASGQKPFHIIAQAIKPEPKGKPLTREEQVAIARAMSTPAELDAARAKVNGSHAPSAQDAPAEWFATAAGIQAQAASLGLERLPGEGLDQLRQRCFERGAV